MRKNKWSILLFVLLLMAVAAAAVILYLVSKIPAPPPDNAAAAEIADRLSDYDGYIVGSGAALSFRPEDLDDYTGCSFANLAQAQSDPEADLALVSWLLSRDRDVKQIFLILSPQDAVQSTAAAEGVPDRRMSDIESVGALEPYLALHEADFQPAAAQPLDGIDRCAECVKEMRALCDRQKVVLTVVLAPQSDAALAAFSEPELNRLFDALSAVTDYWNFTVTSLSSDARYFYDASHPRADAARMVLAELFADGTHWRPSPFGVLCREGEHPDVQTLRDAAQSAVVPYTVTVPALMYHHFTVDAGTSPTLLTPDAFAHQMDLLEREGFHPVSFDDLIRFVDEGVALPERPVLITMDDGYLSNYIEAFPVLRAHGFPATIFAIGCSIGHDHYKDTDQPITPHFGQPEIAEMLASGVMAIQSHTYDMHQNVDFEDTEPVRKCILPFETESEADYIAALETDIRRQSETFAANGLPEPYILAFPGGYHAPISDRVLADHGFRVTLTIDETHVNTLVCGLKQSLIDLGRLNVGPETSDEAILAYLLRTAD